MAGAAIFRHRLMFPQEGAAFFSMAGVARLIEGVFLQQFGAGRAMGIMAIRTGNLAFTNRMVRNTVFLSALLLVAGVAHFRLGTFVAHLVMIRVYLVTGSAGDIIGLMSAARPQMAFAVF